MILRRRRGSVMMTTTTTTKISDFVQVDVCDLVLRKDNN